MSVNFTDLRLDMLLWGRPVRLLLQIMDLLLYVTGSICCCEAKFFGWIVLLCDRLNMLLWVRILRLLLYMGLLPIGECCLLWWPHSLLPSRLARLRHHCRTLHQGPSCVWQICQPRWLCALVRKAACHDGKYSEASANGMVFQFGLNQIIPA